LTRRPDVARAGAPPGRSAVTPVRLRLSRRAKFDLQLLSLETNGLPARGVVRPSIFGNPWKIGPPPMTLERVVALHRAWITGEASDAEIGERLAALRRQVLERLPELRGHNLACWCPLPQPGAPDVCHATVLLELAN
jgi:hypothetical protein